MGILMRGMKKDDVRRGMIVAKPGTLKQHDRFKAQIYMMTKEEGGRERPLTNNIQGRNNSSADVYFTILYTLQRLQYVYL